LNILREGDSTTSLGSLFQCSVTLKPELLREALSLQLKGKLDEFKKRTCENQKEY